MIDEKAGKVVVGGGSEKKTNFMEPTVVSGVKLDDPLMKVHLDSIAVSLFTICE